MEVTYLSLWACCYLPCIMEASFSLSQNQAKDRRGLDGSRFRRCLPWQAASAELTLKMLFGCWEGEDASEQYRRFLGSDTASSPEDTIDEWNLSLGFVSATEIYAGGETYSITLDIPNAIPNQMDEPVKSRDVIETNATLLVRQDPGSEPFTLTIVNGQTEL